MCQLAIWEGKHSVLCILVLAENLAAGCNGIPVVVWMKLSLQMYKSINLPIPLTQCKSSSSAAMAR